MFRNDQQSSRAIRLLLRGVRLENLWGLYGPTDEAVQLLERSPMSHGEIIMLRVAFDFWNGKGHADFADVLNVLDGSNLTRVCTLMQAVGTDSAAVDRWIAAESSSS